MHLPWAAARPQCTLSERTQRRNKCKLTAGGRRAAGEARRRKLSGGRQTGTGFAHTELEEASQFWKESVITARGTD